MMKTQVIDGETYTMVDEETYTDSNGGEWVRWERNDMLAKIRWAEKQMQRHAGRIAEDVDAAIHYTEALEIAAETEEDLRIINELWDL
jgi:hypothetical protein